MKRLLMLAVVFAVTAIAVFEYRQFMALSQTIELARQINVNLDVRGQQRYLLQTLYAALLEDNPGWWQWVETILAGESFNQSFVMTSAGPLLEGWDDADTFERKRQQLDELRTLVGPADLEGQTRQQALATIAPWSRQMIMLLDELQALDMRRSSYLFESLSKRWRATIGVTIVSFLTLFILLAALSLIGRREDWQLHESRSLNTLLADRQSELLQHQEVMTSLLEDMSEERNRAIELAQDIERKNREMEQFIYTVSHDLRSPLVTIDGFARKLRLKLSHTEESSRWLDRIQANVNSMESLLNDLLKLSRVIYLDIDKTPVALHPVIDQALANLESLVADTGATVECREPLVPIFGNERLLIQCLQNLLSNAMKYRDPSRPLRIGIATETADNGVVLRVSDNGIGVEQKYHQQIFRVFERLGTGEGIGVGLAFVKAIVDKHNGSVRLESTPGVGSTFILWFPGGGLAPMADVAKYAGSKQPSENTEHKATFIDYKS